MAKVSESIKNQTSFSLQLTKHVFESQVETPNLVFSPLSIHVFLSMIAAAAEGETLTHLLSILRSRSAEELTSLASELFASVFPQDSDLGGPQTCCANGIWVKESLPLEASFQDTLEKVYRAFVKQVDFVNKAEEIRSEINSWADKETRGLIKEIVGPDSVNSSTSLILANALYFKGAWKEEFNAEYTKDEDFLLLNGKSVQVPFMRGAVDELIRVYDGFKVLPLPYRQGKDKRRLSMHIILPDAKDGLPALLEKVASEAGFLDQYPLYRAKVQRLRMPKFKISFGFDALDALKKLGLGTEDLSLPVSKIIQESFIEVDEEGTQAAAVTVGAVLVSALYSYEDFLANHPFLFLIKEDTTGVVLFAGRVLDPSISC